MFVKICGITNKSDALHAVSQGATHLGLIFVEGSPRCVRDFDLARDLVEAVGDKALVVGVFQNQTMTQIADIAARTKIGAIQLHGQESPAFCRDINQQLGKPVIKAVTIAGIGSAGSDQAGLSEKVRPYTAAADYLLFDRAKGDSNQNWLPEAVEQLRQLEKELPADLPAYFFAGGLSSDNVAQTLRQLKACGADVASGVEKSPGQKDALLVQNFIGAVKSLESQTEKEQTLRSEKQS